MKVVHTIAGMSVLPEEVALSAVALVGPVDVGTLLTARVSQTLVYICVCKVRNSNCESLLDQEHLTDSELIHL